MEKQKWNLEKEELKRRKNNKKDMDLERDKEIMRQMKNTMKGLKNRNYKRKSYLDIKKGGLIVKYMKAY